MSVLGCKHENIISVWLTPELEGYKCLDCLMESLDPPNEKPFPLDFSQESFDFHQKFLMKLCNLLDLDYLLMNEDKILDEISIIKNK